MKNRFTLLILIFGLFSSHLYGQATKKTLLEVATGSWGGYCPEGRVFADQIVADHPNAIYVEVHVGDAMSTNDGNVISDEYINAYPTGNINRVYTGKGRVLWDSLVQQELNTATPVGVLIENVSFDVDTREIKATVRAEVHEVVDMASWHMNLFVTEDSITGTGSSYDQINNYNTQSGHPFFGAGNPIINYPHRNVVRAMLGGAWGTPGLFPVNPGGNLPVVVEHTYSYILPISYDEYKVRLIALVQNYDDQNSMNRHILNVEWTPDYLTALTPDNDCAGANNINNLFGGSLNVPQISEIWDNSNYTSANDPTTGFDCFYQMDGLQNTVWYSFTSATGNTYGIRTVQCNATNYIIDGDTQMAIYSGDNCGNLTPVACGEDEDGANGLLNAYVELPTIPGVTYYMLIDGYLGLFGEFCLEVTNLAPNGIIEIGSTDIEIFPNPTTGEIQLTNVDADQVQVFDSMGRLVFSAKQPGTSIDISAMAAGMYFLKITEGEAVYSTRVVKE